MSDYATTYIPTDWRESVFMKNTICIYIFQGDEDYFWGITLCCQYRLFYCSKTSSYRDLKSKNFEVRAKAEDHP